MLKKLVLTGVCLLVISGCATNHMIAPDRKPDLQPQANSATLVVIRDTAFGFGVVFWHYLDGKFIGETKGKTYFVTRVAPGPHYVMVTTENTATAYLDFQPGTIYYLREGVLMGAWRARTSGFSPVDAQEAAQAMKDCAYWEYDPGTKAEDMSPQLYQQAIAEYQGEVKQNPGGFKNMLDYKGVAAK